MLSVSSCANLPSVYCLQWDVCSNKALPMYFDYIDCFLIECWEFLVCSGCKTLIWHVICKYQVFPGGASGKESACQCRRHKRSSGVGNGNPLQDSCLENSMDRGTPWATVHGVAELDMTDWAHILSCKYLFPVYGCFLFLLTVSFEKQNNLILKWFYQFFFYESYFFLVIFKSLPNLKSQRVYGTL